MKQHHQNNRSNHSRLSNRDSILIGRNSIREILRFAPSRIKKVFLASVNSKDIDEIASELEGSGISIQFLSFDKLTEIAGSDSHQGVVAELAERPAHNLKDVLKKLESQESSLLLMVDSIFDPHNFGAILRAAECLGADGVIYSRNRGCAVTAAVTKTSAGASEIVPIIEVGNLANSLESAHDRGFFSVIADVGEGCELLPKFTFPSHTLLIMGSEGEGIQPLIKSKAHFRLTIPQFGQIDSLNVSQATAVMLYAFRAQRGDRVST